MTYVIDGKTTRHFICSNNNQKIWPESNNISEKKKKKDLCTVFDGPEATVTAIIQKKNK